MENNLQNIQKKKTDRHFGHVAWDVFLGFFIFMVMVMLLPTMTSDRNGLFGGTAIFLFIGVIAVLTYRFLKRSERSRVFAKTFFYLSWISAIIFECFLLVVALISPGYLSPLFIGVALVVSLILFVFVSMKLLR